jgi:hypothetical protein
MTKKIAFIFFFSEESFKNSFKQNLILINMSILFFIRFDAILVVFRGLE